MTKTAKQAADSFGYAMNYCKGNTKVFHDKGISRLYLYGNLIAEKSAMGLSISNAGWPTKTTMDRLNALPNVSIYQKNGDWYLNGVLWDGSWCVVVGVVNPVKENVVSS